MGREKTPIYLANIEFLPNGEKYFVRGNKPYLKVRGDVEYTANLFASRKEYIDKPNCNFNCPPGKEFYCCKKYNCVAHFGFFAWDELSLFSEEEKEEILSSWNGGTGFYRKRGCALPRYLRSYICLSWVCSYNDQD